MKKITIWDMDFYYKKSFLPNPIAMKLSSFHKQQSDLVNFVIEEYHIKMSFDVYYIIREKDSTPRPDGKLVDDKRVKLIGRGFRFFDGYWEIPPLISAVRPDYMLYPHKDDAYYNAEILQFYHNGKKIKLRQPIENSYRLHKKTLVIDKEFWDVSDENIEFSLQELKTYKNIAFLHPINLKKILNTKSIRELFKELDFSQSTIFRFRNNYGQSYDDALVIFDFMLELKAAHPHVKFTNVPFRSVTTDHWQEKENAMYDLTRCLMIVDAAKEKGIYIRLVSPDDRLESPYWYYFEVLENWTLNLPTLSYVEMMLLSAEKKSGYAWFQILNNSRRWFTPNTYFLLKMMTRTGLVELYGFRKWGDTFLDRKMINYKEIDKFRGMEADIPTEED